MLHRLDGVSFGTLRDMLRNRNEISSSPINPYKHIFCFGYRSCGGCDKDSRPRKDLPRGAILDVSLLLGYSDRWEG